MVSMVGKPIATKKLALQLTNTATLIAAGLGPWENSSAVIILKKKAVINYDSVVVVNDLGLAYHGIDPGPTAKNTT